MTLTDLKARARFAVFADSTNTQYADPDLEDSIDEWYRTVIGWILPASGGWQVNGDIFTADIKAGQREYPFPSDLILLDKVYIQPSVNDEMVEANQRDLSDIHNYYGNYVPENPEFDTFDNSLFIYIPYDIITDVPGGLQVVGQTDITSLSANDTPNLPSAFQKILYKGAAMDYCNANEMYNKAASLLKDIYGVDGTGETSGLKKELLKLIASRAMIKPVVMEPEEQNFI